MRSAPCSISHQLIIYTWAWETGNLAAHFCQEGVMGLWERHPTPPARLQFTLLARDGVELEGLVTVPGEMVLVLLLRPSRGPGE